MDSKDKMIVFPLSNLTIKDFQMRLNHSFYYLKILNKRYKYLLTILINYYNNNNNNRENQNSKIHLLLNHT